MVVKVALGAANKHRDDEAQPDPDEDIAQLKKQVARLKRHVCIQGSIIAFAVLLALGFIFILLLKEFSIYPSYDPPEYAYPPPPVYVPQGTPITEKPVVYYD